MNWSLRFAAAAVVAGLLLSACNADCPEGTWCAGVLPDGGLSDGGLDDGGVTDGGPDGGSLDIAAEVTLLVGNDGGTVVLDGPSGRAELVIPFGALAEDVEISIAETRNALPSGFTGFSPLYVFRPEGLTFSLPATVTLPFEGDPQLASIFWSRSEAPGFERLGGVAAADEITAQVDHFSQAFVADGVNYTDPASRECARARLIQVRSGAGASIPTPQGMTTTSAMVAFFAVEDCAGRPIADLDVDDFEILENGEQVSTESRHNFVGNAGVQSFVRILVDRSNSTFVSRDQIEAAVRSLVERLMVENSELNIQVALDVFAGGSDPVTELQHPTLSAAELLGPPLDGGVPAIDRMTDFRAVDINSTNLYGAITDSLGALNASQSAFESRNNGGVFTSGYLVVFTDGRDTSGIVSLDTAVSAINGQTQNQVMIVALAESGDYDPASLTALASGGKYLSTPERLEGDVADLANRIAGKLQRTYIVGYCSPKRAGSHSLSIGVTGSELEGTEAFFDASGFGPGCDPAGFEPEIRCADKECGGMACGACDDRVAACVGTQCVSHCETSTLRCGGFQLAPNPRGYLQTCHDSPASSSCNGTCVDLTSDPTHCGACNTACGFPSVCSLGQCLAPIDQHPNGGGGALAVSSGFAYWGSNGLRRTQVDASSGTQVNAVAIGEIESNGATIYWAQPGQSQIGSLPAGSPGATPGATPANGTLSAIAATPANLFWIVQAPSATQPQLFHQPLGGGPGNFYNFPDFNQAPNALEAAGNLAFFGSTHGYDQIWQLDAQSGGMSRLTGNTIVSRMVAVGQRVFWTNASGVLTASSADSSGTTWFTGLPAGGSPELFATDGTNLYFVSGNVLWRMGTDGAGLTRFAEGFSFASLAVDDTHVYWTSGGRLYRRTK